MSAKFKEAAERVKSLTKRPSDSELLELYGLFKQATSGDAAGAKPGLFDIKGKKKFEAWTKLKGTAQEKAAEAYVALVDRLEKK
jgi:diazepam-binding inhibitor (GABA receptor modulating acyl-CoA-binding protein)